MEIRIGFTIISGPEGWQIPPIQFLKVYDTGGKSNLESLKNDLQAVMDFADEKLKPYKKVSKDDAIIQALQTLANNQLKLAKQE